MAEVALEQLKNNLQPINNSTVLFKNPQGKIIYRREINYSQIKINQQNEDEKEKQNEDEKEKQNEDEKENLIKEIKVQNQLATNFKQYIKILEYTFEKIREERLIIYMLISTQDEYNSSSLQYFSDIKDRFRKQILFQYIFKVLLDLEENKCKVLYLHYNNLFFSGDQFYLTIFGCINSLKIQNPSVQSLQRKIQEQQKSQQQKKSQSQRLIEDLLKLFQEGILNINAQDISIEEINSRCSHDQKLQQIAKVLIDSRKNNNSIEQIYLSIYVAQERQQIQQRLIEEWQILYLKVRQTYDVEQAKKGIEFQCLKELSYEQLNNYIKILKDFQSQDNCPNKEKTKLLIQQAEYRKEAMSLMERNIQDPHPNLIYFLNEKELQQLKQDQSKLQQFNQQEQTNVIDKINQYLQLLEKFLYGNLDGQVLSDNQLQLIPVKILKCYQIKKIQDFCQSKIQQIERISHGIECFAFELPLEAKKQYDKFISTINNSNGNQLDFKLKFEQIKLLDNSRVNNYRNLILRRINSLSNDQIQNFVIAFNESFEQIKYQELIQLEIFTVQLYSIKDKGVVYSDFNNDLDFSPKLLQFYKRRFNGDILIDSKYKSYLRNFGYVKNSNYNGHMVESQKHGLGLLKIDKTHLKFGIFQLNKLLWGWEIKQNNNIISFYKGEFLNEQKYGYGIQKKYDYSGPDPYYIEEYEGMFLKDQRDGIGQLKKINNLMFFDLYEGHFKEDQLNGFVRIFQNEDTLVYQGQFRNGKKNGLGKEFQKNLEYNMIGDYSNDQPNGTHTIIYYRDSRTEKKLFPSVICLIF